MYQKILAEIDQGPLTQALAVLPPKMTSLRARAQLLKTMLQESRGTARRQYGNGPARGLWQFELGALHGQANGKEWGLFVHPATKAHLVSLAIHRGVEPNPRKVYQALEHDDVLAAGVARLNYWWVSTPLPDIYNEPGSWHYYNSTWNPGKPHRDTWPRFHSEVLDYLQDLK